jgi:hypothetical protein
MECHFIGLLAVDFPFGLRDPLKDADGMAFDEIREGALLDEIADRGEAAAMMMVVVVVLLLLMRVMMMLFLRRMMVIVMGMLLLWMTMFFFFMPMMMMVVLMGVMGMMRVVLLIILRMGMGGPFVDGKFHSLDILPHLPLPMRMEIADLQLRKFPFEGGWFYPEVAEGPDGHIATDAGEAVQVEHTHRAALFHCRRDFPSALAMGGGSALIEGA